MPKQAPKQESQIKRFQLEIPKDPLPFKKPKKLLKKSEKIKQKEWFQLPEPKLTPELKTDLKILNLRGVLDPKNPFNIGKKKAPYPKKFQIGRVLDEARDFYSSRLTKKERKQTFVDELLSDSNFRQYTKKKFLEIQKNAQNGGKNWYKKIQKKRLKRKK